MNSAESEFKRETLLDAAESAGFQIPPGLDLFRDRAALAERIMASRLAQCAAQIEWIKGGISFFFFVMSILVLGNFCDFTLFTFFNKNLRCSPNSAKRFIPQKTK